MMQNAIVAINPVQAIEQAKKLSDIVRVMRADVLRANVDYGVIPGTNKPTLLKPGAERLCSALGLNPKFDFMDKVEVWNPDAPLFNYTVICRLIHIESGSEIATGIGSCNSMESKYRWRNMWPSDAQKAGVDTDGLRKNKKGQYMVPNDDVFGIVNTIQKMACKRALIAAVLIGANASEFFTQDIEDMRDFGSMDIIEGEYEEMPTTTPPLKIVPQATPKSEPQTDGSAALKPEKNAVHWSQDAMAWRSFRSSIEDQFGQLAEKLPIDWTHYDTPRDGFVAVQKFAADERWPLISRKATYIPPKNGSGGGEIQFHTPLFKVSWFAGRTELDAATEGLIGAKEWKPGDNEITIPVRITWSQKTNDQGEPTYKHADKVEPITADIPF